MNLKKILASYFQTINRNILGANASCIGLAFWQNRLFALILTYLLPMSLLAIIPGIIMSLIGKVFFLAASNILTFIFLVFISFKKRLNITARKSIFILTLYLAALVLLYNLGSFGPGLLYLLAIVIFTTIIFNRRVAYWSVLLNTIICLFFSIAIHFKFTNSLLASHYTLGSWIAVSSNLIVLSVIITALLPTIFKGLQNNIEEQEGLKIILKSEQGALKKVIKKVKHKNTELEEFAYTASHDLQEPLRMVSSFLIQLEKNNKAQLDEKGQRYISFARDGAERMKKTISNLLEYSLAEKKRLKIEQVDMNRLIGEYVDQNNSLLEEMKATVTWNNLPVISGDRFSMQQLLQNLISNGIKYQKTGENPLINISYTETSQYWEFAVSDNGIGISPEFFDKIFVVFQRLHDKSDYSGTGIGLAICKKIIDQHRGKIWLQSIPGQGSTFYFTIDKHLN